MKKTDKELQDVTICTLYYAEYTETESRKLRDERMYLDSNLLKAFSEHDFWKTLSSKHKRDILQLAGVLAAMSMAYGARLTVLLSEPLQMLSFEVSAPSFLFRSKQFANLINAFFLSSDMEFFPSSEVEGDCVLAFDYCYESNGQTLRGTLDRLYEELMAEIEAEKALQK